MTDTEFDEDRGVKTSPAPGAASEGGPEYHFAFWRRGWSASAGRVALLAAVMTPTLIALVAYERCQAVKQAAAAAAVPRIDTRAGAVLLHSKAVIELPPSNRPTTCSYVAAPGARVLCPAGSGAIEGACEDGAPGDLLVSWAGTGWLCPAPRPGAADQRTASVLCCK